MAVVGVLAEAEVGDDGGVGLGDDAPRGLLNDAVLGPAPRTDGVLRLGDAEEDDCLDAGVGDLPHAVDRLVDRHTLVPRHRGDLDAFVRRRVHEHGRDEVLRREARLADEPPYPVAPQAAGALGEVHGRASAAAGKSVPGPSEWRLGGDP